MSSQTINTTWRVEHGPDTLTERPSHEYHSLEAALSFIFYESSLPDGDVDSAFARLLADDHVVARFGRKSSGIHIYDAEPLVEDAWHSLLADG